MRLFRRRNKIQSNTIPVFEESNGPKNTLWLVNDDPEEKWFCKCQQGVVDAPWHNLNTYPDGGEGWLFTCVKCNKAFMFARAAYISNTFEDMANQKTPRTKMVISIDGSARTETYLATPQDWLDLVLPMTNNLVEGQRYVFLDNCIIPVTSGPVRCKGLFREHDLPQLPHTNEELTSQTIGNLKYWYPDHDWDAKA